MVDGALKWSNMADMRLIGVGGHTRSYVCGSSRCQTLSSICSAIKRTGEHSSIGPRKAPPRPTLVSLLLGRTGLGVPGHIFAFSGQRQTPNGEDGRRRGGGVILEKEKGRPRNCLISRFDVAVRPSVRLSVCLSVCLGHSL